MAETTEFKPQWASPPGATIIDILEQKGMSIEDFCSAMQTSERLASKIISGDAEIDARLAIKLENVLGGSAAFWLRREAQFRSDLQRLDEAVVEMEPKAWLSTLPVRDITAFGWVERIADRALQAEALLRFFDTQSVQGWHNRYQRTVTAVAYRTSQTYESKLGALAAWLRQGEIEAEKIACAPWDREGLRLLIPKFRALTRVKDPAVFLPELQKLCASCGVAVVIVRAPAGCRASGATRFVSEEKAVIQLSFRYRSDDHFWFTLFHELGHLLLHDCSSIFLEDLDLIATHEEDEANDFAANTLVPPEYRAEMLRLPADHRVIMRFAKRIGVSHGIVVGQMQHLRVLAPNRLNALKVRYTWTAE
ncbi:ImmA/IrrE family metallo-endopeptidase [Azospirillum himalayense]|uniref:ImmA/IrrE family metallo-endopeptidase n=1 Tax=Azospirillum himalayense TaxID=654847 RepID=A0ABW0GEU4_9PROT